ncbi:MAG: hypothetical protein F6K09_15700, partial [Merismopedia sp. SIO2A8]|nr:hypothetical protein [Merismopedia sp. SIO2A8]
CQSNYCLLVDSLGTWVANLLEQNEAAWEKSLQELFDTLGQTKGTVIFVAEETGWGVVPAYPLGRSFRDRLGQLVRQLGIVSNPVYLVCPKVSNNSCKLFSQAASFCSKRFATQVPRESTSRQ